MTFTKTAIAVGLALLLSGTELSGPCYGQNDSTVTDSTVSVNELAKNPKGFAGREIVVTGVVAVIAPKQKMFTIIDRSEYAECNVVTCARYEIPIGYSGELPKSEQIVAVSGKLAQVKPGRFLFEAKHLVIVK
jgi:hypothetical protein